MNDSCTLFRNYDRAKRETGKVHEFSTTAFRRPISEERGTVVSCELQVGLIHLIAIYGSSRFFTVLGFYENYAVTLLKGCGPSWGFFLTRRKEPPLESFCKNYSLAPPTQVAHKIHWPRRASQIFSTSWRNYGFTYVFHVVFRRFFTLFSFLSYSCYSEFVKVV